MTGYVPRLLNLNELSRLDWAIRECLVKTLTDTRWNKRKSSKLLGIGRMTLDRMIARYQITRRETEKFDWD